MGMNIFVYRLGKRSTVTTDYGSWTSFEREEYTDFDDTRFSGDKDLALAHELEWEEVDDDPNGQTLAQMGDCYLRPKDFEKVRAWVKSNVFEGNQPRLLNLFDAMEADSSIWLRFAW